ncbi:hypothetical protein EGR_01859 [Echinococcus granulosus]|uniref:Uncharacterized protein n=1 Tax=Echinococcus granulosus TaxID=6210 RepID=W6UQ52_ECHGR|nr:hypothetical protein EGR_01859 [Echinococcus granulosus]EUB63368.1 hypothetical protein EGR_01859 [Echinococcus granulosus]
MLVVIRANWSWIEASSKLPPSLLSLYMCVVARASSVGPDEFIWDLPQKSKVFPDYYKCWQENKLTPSDNSAIIPRSSDGKEHSKLT